MSTEQLNKDAWLHALRTDPSPQFKEELRARLREQETTGETREVLSRRQWSRRSLVAAAAVVVVAALLAVPAVRASVAQFVSFLRVGQVTPIQVDASNLDRLEAENLEIGSVIDRHIEFVKDPGPPVWMGSLSDAATAAGMTLALPRWLPDDTEMVETGGRGERVLRVTGNSELLQQVMTALAIKDLAVPPGLDGYVVNVRVPPVAIVGYHHDGERRTRLFQARSPEITLPDSIEIRTLAEIGLRILGQPPAEAKHLAQTIDWHTTLILPVPPFASSFREVTVGGYTGVLIERRRRDGMPLNTVVWSTPDRVFALVTMQDPSEALRMAGSVR